MPITFDAKTIGYGISSSSSLTFAHTVGAGANFLNVYVGGYITGLQPTGVTYAGESLTLTQGQTSSTTQRSWFYQKVAPAAGANNVVITFGGSPFSITGQANSWSGVDQIAPTGTPASAGGSANNASLSPASAVGDVVVDGIAIFNSGTFTPNVPQTQLSQLLFGGSQFNGSSYKTGSSPTTAIGWTWQFSGGYSHIAFAMKVATGDLLRSPGMEGGMEGGMKMAGMTGGMRA